MDKIITSACLLGDPVRYDGSGKLIDHPLVKTWQEEGRLVRVCPEIIGGFETPRPPAEITEGKQGVDVLEKTGTIQDVNGEDVTELFLKGARRGLEIALKHQCNFALLTDGSPSCGSSYIYDGSFSSKRIIGMGVFATLLIENGIQVFSQDQLCELSDALKQPGS